MAQLTRPEVTVEIVKNWIRRSMKLRSELDEMEYELKMVLEWYGNPVIYINRGQAVHKL